MALERELISGGKASGAGAHDQDFLTCLLFGFDELVAVFQSVVAEEPFDRVNADRSIQLAAVAGAFTGVVADAAHAGGQRIAFG